MDQDKDLRGLIRRADYSVASVAVGGRIVSEMSERSLEFADALLAEWAGLDALVQEGKKLRKDRAGMTDENIRAYSLFHRAALAGHDEAQVLVGWCNHVGDGIPKDQVQAVTWYRKGAESGNAKAMLRLGLHYERGMGVHKDEDEAIKWCSEAAEKGIAVACLAVAQIYKDRKEETKALDWYEKGGELGSFDSLMAAIIYAYDWGRADAERFARAKRWSQSLADRDGPDNLTWGLECLTRLGIYYEEGWNGVSYLADAVSCYREAAERGDACARFCLARIYRSGKGVERSLSEAYAWFRAAEEGGHKEARKEAVALSARFSPDELAFAEHLYRQRRGNHHLEP